MFQTLEVTFPSLTPSCSDAAAVEAGVTRSSLPSAGLTVHSAAPAEGDRGIEGSGAGMRERCERAVRRSTVEEDLFLEGDVFTVLHIKLYKVTFC